MPTGTPRIARIARRPRRRLPAPPAAYHRRPALLLIIAIAAIAALAACTASPPAADFTLTTFAGDQFRLSEQRGRTVVINFWYPSCPPCRDEMPAFQQLWEQRQDDNLRILGLFVPQGLDTEVEARQFVDELGLTFDFATDVRAQIAREYAVQYFPTTYFIDPAGRIHQMEISRLDAHRLTDILNSIPSR